VWTDGLVERVTNYTDIDAARAAAERLAVSRRVGDGAGELMTPWASPAMDEMAETCPLRPGR
jgi:hypothetical protein